MKKILFYSLMVVFTFSVIEVMLQGFYYVSASSWLFERVDPPIYEEREAYSYGVRKNLEYIHGTNEFKIKVYTNNFGMRASSKDEYASFEKPNNVFRILTMGPSFTFGWGVNFEENYPILIKNLLGNKIRGKDIEIINMGVPGHSVGMQLCWLRDEIRRFEPDFILQAIYALNIDESCIDRSNVKVYKNHLYDRDPDAFFYVKKFLKNFAIVFYALYLEEYFFGEDLEDMGTEFYGEESQVNDNIDINSYAQKYINHSSYVRSLVGEHVGIAFLYIPLAYEVDKGDIPRWKYSMSGDLGLEAKKSKQLADGFSRKSSELGVVFINSRDVLAKAAKLERMYYWFDTHLTKRGNEVLAGVAAKRLNEYFKISTISKR